MTANMVTVGATTYLRAGMPQGQPVGELGGVSREQGGGGAAAGNSLTDTGRLVITCFETTSFQPLRAAGVRTGAALLLK